MNVALPAFIIFILLLPGFIFRTRLKRAERTSLDYSPLGQVVAEAVLWALLAHLIWLLFSYWLFDRALDPAALIKLLSSDPAGQAKASDNVGENFRWISAYFTSLFAASYFIPKRLRYLISKFRLDRAAAKFSYFFRFHQAPWYYLFTGADFTREDEPDIVTVSAIVEIAGAAILYTGTLDEFFVDADGQLDRLVLQDIMRRPLHLDKEPHDLADAAVLSRFYPIDGDYFVLRYSETITLNIQYAMLRSRRTHEDSEVEL